MAWSSAPCRLLPVDSNKSPCAAPSCTRLVTPTPSNRTSWPIVRMASVCNLGTEAFSSRDRHGAADAEWAGFVGRGADDSSASKAADDNGQAAQFGAVALLD